MTYDCPWFDVSLFGLGCSGEYRIAVPPDTGITGHSGNGELRVTGLDGPLDLRTSNGDIHLDGTAGPIEVHTSNGQVTGAELVSAQLQATTSNGEVVVGFATAPDDVLIDTSNGSVEVVVPDDGGPWAVDPSTSNGDVTTDVTTDPDAPRRLVLRTSNGDILVRTD